MRKFRQNQPEKEKIESFSLSLAGKASRILILLTLLCLPVQLGKHFWPNFAFIRGLRVDYLSPTLYVTDILIGLLFLTTSIAVGINMRSHSRGVIQFLRAHKFSLLATSLWTISLIYGILHASHPMSGWYAFLKLIEFCFFGILISKRIDIRRDGVLLIGIFSAGITLEVLLGITQLYLQRSVGGIFYFLGERTFSAETPGIANTSIHGDLILRPYGTFPHPNVYAAYLLISLLLIAWCTSLQLPRSDSENGSVAHRKQLLINWIWVTSIASIGIISSLSRSVVIVLGLLLLGTVLFFLRLKQRRRICYSVLGAFLIGMSVLLFFTPVGYRLLHFRIGEESVQQREQLTSYAIKEFRVSPFVGVGLHNGLYPLPSYEVKDRSLLLQPVHSLPLFILAETGLCGLCFFSLFLSSTLRRLLQKQHRIFPFILLSSVLLLGLTDHYFLTLQQGQLLLTTLLGILWSYIFLAPVMKKN